MEAAKRIQAGLDKGVFVGAAGVRAECGECGALEGLRKCMGCGKGFCFFCDGGAVSLEESDATCEPCARKEHR